MERFDFAETEISNKGALNLYENLGFTRDKRLEKYYLNGGDAFRLKLKLPTKSTAEEEHEATGEEEEGEADTGGSKEQ